MERINLKQVRDENNRKKMHSFVLNVLNMLLSMIDGIKTKRKGEQGGGKRQSFSKEESVEKNRNK